MLLRRYGRLVKARGVHETPTPLFRRYRTAYNGNEVGCEVCPARVPRFSQCISTFNGRGNAAVALPTSDRVPRATLARERHRRMPCHCGCSMQPQWQCWCGKKTMELQLHSGAHIALMLELSTDETGLGGWS